MDYRKRSRAKDFALAKIDRITRPRRLHNGFNYFATTKAKTIVGGTDTHTLVNGFEILTPIYVGELNDPFTTWDLYGTDGVLDADSLYRTAGTTEMVKIYPMFRVLSSTLKVRFRMKDPVVTTKLSHTSATSTETTALPAQVDLYAWPSTTESSAMGSRQEILVHPAMKKIPIPMPSQNGSRWSKWLTISIPNHHKFMSKLFAEGLSDHGNFQQFWVVTGTPSQGHVPYVHLALVDRLGNSDTAYLQDYQFSLTQEILWSKATANDTGVMGKIGEASRAETTG